MSKTYYEAHVTMTGNREELEPLTKAMGWRFSAIDGDANLGDGLKLYATKQFNSRRGDASVTAELLDVGQTLRGAGAKVLREKVEVVIFDTRSSKVQACTDCAACQEAR